jgi:hypothetical protein
MRARRWSCNAGVNVWRRTTITTRRALAAHLGYKTRDIDDHQKLVYIKVVEYQRRGLVHLHVLARLDPAQPNGEPVDPSVLADALRTGAAKAAAPNPLHPEQPIRWGPQLDIRLLQPDLRRAAANYLAKYATKSTDPHGALDHRLRSPDLIGFHIPRHLAAMAETAWHLAQLPHLQHLNLRLWAHTLGYRGHWLTKSRGWSTTFTELRTARHHWQLAQHGHTPNDPQRHGQCDYHGMGHTTPGDTWLAEVAHHNKTLNQRTAWEEK